jgi:hypothetical protein
LQQEAGAFTSGIGFSLAHAQAASGFSQAAASSSSVSLAPTDIAATSTDAKLLAAKITLSISDLFLYSGVAMRAMGVDLYNATRSSGAMAATADAKSLLDKSTTNELFNQKLLPGDHGPVISDSLHDTSLVSPQMNSTATSATGLLNSTMTPDAVSPTAKLAPEGPVLSDNFPSESAATASKQPNETTIQTISLPSSLPAGDAAAPKFLPTAPASAGQEPAMVRSAAEIVQVVQSMVSFAYDPSHKIALEGQDLEILRILVQANPLIAGADRVLLSHGQILAGDGVMLMPGVALLPAEVFVPKLVASLPTAQEGVLEIVFRDDLTVTLAGVIDL